MYTRVVVVVGAALAVGLLLTACGGGAGDEPPATQPTGQEGGAGQAETGDATDGGEALTFVAVDIAFDSAPQETSAGEATLRLENQGDIMHNLTIEDLNVDVDAEGGETADTTATLEPGTYTYFCNVPGHRDAGMEGELTVN